MRFIYRIALVVVVAAIMLAANLAGAQNKKVVDLKAPVINEKEIKVECVHTYPHMILRSKVKETAEFRITPDVRVDRRSDCEKAGEGRYKVAPGQRCTLFFEEEEVGKSVKQVSAETPTTRYTFRGDWPVYVCCRGKVESREYSTGKERVNDAQMSAYLKTGNFYRGYEITLYPDRVDSHNREKDTINPLSTESYWRRREFTKGFCAKVD